jgi:hypothetical protein
MGRKMLVHFPTNSVSISPEGAGPPPQHLSHLSPEGQRAPTLAEAIADRVERRRRILWANPPAKPKAAPSPYQDYSPRSGTPPARAHAGDVDTRAGIQFAFPGLIPAKPYCADEPQHGLEIRARAVALRRMHLQFNAPAAFRWMLHDIDAPGAAVAHDDAYLPPPNVITVNPGNGHAHSAYLLRTPVARHSAARIEPLRYFAAVERGVARRLGADRLYVGLIAKNPWHRHWRVEWRRDEPYTLDELADWLFPRDMVPDASPRTTLGAGRNVTVFDELRTFAYREVRAFKSRDERPDAFRARLERVALGLNQQFPQGLLIGEVRAIAKSVTKWTWKHFSVERFRARQSYLGKRGNAKRWAGHQAESSTKPWQALGISRATYYRRKRGVAKTP